VVCFSSASSQVLSGLFCLNDVIEYLFIACSDLRHLRSEVFLHWFRVRFDVTCAKKFGERTNRKAIPRFSISPQAVNHENSIAFEDLYEGTWMDLNDFVNGLKPGFRRPRFSLNGMDYHVFSN
jgi:hypothetical protein